MAGINQDKINFQDVNKLLWHLDHYLLEYHNILNISKNNKFGIEIEYAKAGLNEVTSKIKENYQKELLTKHYKNTVWKNVKESTVHFVNVLTDTIYGGEIVSPILIDEKKTWQELELICNMLKELNAEITEQASVHIHVDISILKNNIENWLKLIKLWIIYEEVIYRFLYGEYTKGRDSEHYLPVRKEYLYLLRKRNLEEITDLEELKKKIYIAKYKGLNFSNLNYYNLKPPKNTIEVRVANGTLEPTIIQNNILFVIRLFEATDKISNDFLNEKLSKLKLNAKEEFNEIYIYEAIELANLIYENEIEKLSFLKQYLKNYEVTEEFKKVKSFIK